MMSWRPVFALGVGALLALAACGSGGGASSLAPTAGPSGTPPATVSPTASTSPGATVSPATSTRAAACHQTGDQGVVPVSIADFEFKPASIEAKVGQVVAFNNTGFEPHNATVEAGCATRTLQTGETDGLVFSVAGTYKFACTVHAWMTGTILIAP